MNVQVSSLVTGIHPYFRRMTRFRVLTDILIILKASINFHKISRGQRAVRGNIPVLILKCPPLSVATSVAVQEYDDRVRWQFAVVTFRVIGHVREYVKFLQN
jgi:hypothetical protein